MAPIEKIGGVARNLYNPVDAVKLYETTNKRIGTSGMENPFAGARQGLGVGAFCFAGEGRIDGQPPTQYYTNENGYTEEVTRTLDFFG